MPLEKRPPEGIVSQVRELVLSTVPEFIDFHIHLPTFLWQLRCSVERIIRKRLSDHFIHITVQYLGQVQTAAVFLATAKDYVKLSCCRSICYCSEFQRQLNLKLASDVQDWIALWTSESKIVILI